MRARMGPVRMAGGLEALYSPAWLERLRAEAERLRAGPLVSAAVRRRGAKRPVRLGSQLTLEGHRRELSYAQRGWEALLAAAEGTEAAALPERSQEMLLYFLDLGLLLIRRLQTGSWEAAPGGRRRVLAAEPAGGRQQQEGGPLGGRELGSLLVGGEATPRGATSSPGAAEEEGHPAPLQEEEEEAAAASLDVLREEVDALQKEVGALGQEGAAQAKVEDLNGKVGVLASALDDFISQKIWTLEQEAEALWDAWFQNSFRREDLGLLQEKVDSLKDVLQKFLWDSPLQQKVSALRKVEALRDALQEERSALCRAPLERDALWEKVTELNFALWEIQLDQMVAFQEVVEAFRDGLTEVPQKQVRALQEMLEATQEVLRAAPLKDLSALRKSTSILVDALADFPGVIPAQEKQDTLWDALRDVPLKEMSDLWEKVRSLWGIPLEMFAVWEKVGSLKLFLGDASRKRVRNLQENVEALNDALREALQKETGVHKDRLNALWASLQGFPLNELVALEDKLNTLLEDLWNGLEEKPPLLKETVGVPQENLGSLHSTPQGQLSGLLEEEVDAVQVTLAEEITKAEKSEDLSAWKNPGADWPVSMPNEAVSCRSVLQGHGTFSATQQRDLPKTGKMINLNVEHEMSVTSSYPDGHERSKRQNAQETDELTSKGSISKGPLDSSEQSVPELASSEPPPKKQKMDVFHSPQVPSLEWEMVCEYKRYRKCIFAILNQYKSRVDKLRTRLKQSPDQTSALKYTEEAKALTCTLKKERALLQWFDCFRDLRKSRNNP